jgi:hypothetical protein
VGQHRFRDSATVVTEQESRTLYEPESALIEIDMGALRDPRCMVALWMIGHGNHRSGPARSAWRRSSAATSKPGRSGSAWVCTRSRTRRS